MKRDQELERLIERWRGGGADGDGFILFMIVLFFVVVGLLLLAGCSIGAYIGFENLKKLLCQ